MTNNQSLLNIKNGLNLWEKAESIIPGGNMLLSKNKNVFSPELWPCYYSKVKGAYAWDIDGNKYIDFSSNGVGACSLGHACSEIDNAVINCIKNGIMSTLNNPKEVYLAEKLIELHPWAGMVKFARTGGEANALSIRIARAYSGKDKIVICGYHGWHDWYLACNISNNNNLNDHLIEGLESKGVPKILRDTIISIKYNSFDDLKLIENMNDIAAIKLEVLRSTPPKAGYLEEIKDICTKKGILLIFDECTSGFREAFGGIHKNFMINPDICILGKALGNGYAITSVIGTKEVMSAACNTFISSTFWTEAIGPSAAIATIERMKRIKSWLILPKIGLEVKNIWKELALKYSIPIKIAGIDALPTFNFESYKPLAFKTAFTEIMLKKGFLASTLFYPTTAHTSKDIGQYANAVEETFKLFSDILISKSNPDQLCKGKQCKPTFKRLN